MKIILTKFQFPISRISEWTFLSWCWHVGNTIWSHISISNCLLCICSSIFEFGNNIGLSIFGSTVSLSINPMEKFKNKKSKQKQTNFISIIFRFQSKIVRRLASATFIVRNTFMLGITLYTPCVALNTVAGIPYWASFLLMTLLGIVFTIFVSNYFFSFDSGKCIELLRLTCQQEKFINYCEFSLNLLFLSFCFWIKGNLKAAITADVIQGITMILVSFGVIAQGVYEAGGVEKVYKISRDHGK